MKKMPVQFTLSRMFQLVAIVAALCSLFASLKWPAALCVLAVVNVVACLGFLFLKRTITAILAAVTAALIVYTLAFASRHLLIMMWLPLIPACVSQLAAILSWFLSDNRLSMIKK
jgi:hypothetical protein